MLLLGVYSIRVFAKNMGDSYYEPTIMVHAKFNKKIEIFCISRYCNKKP